MRAQTKRPPGDEQSRLGRVQIVSSEHFAAIDRRHEFRPDRDTGDMNPIPWQPESLHVNAILLLRDEIPMERAGDPKGMKMEIGDHDSQLRLQPAETN